MASEFAGRRVGTSGRVSPDCPCFQHSYWCLLLHIQQIPFRQLIRRRSVGAALSRSDACADEPSANNTRHSLRLITTPLHIHTSDDIKSYFHNWQL